MKPTPEIHRSDASNRTHQTDGPLPIFSLSQLNPKPPTRSIHMNTELIDTPYLTSTPHLLTTAHRHLQGPVRALGSIEQFFWLLDQNRPTHFVVTAQIAGATPNLNWRKAIDAVQKRHPLLSAWIDGAPGSMPYFHCSPQASIPLRVVYGEPDQLWETEAGMELATPIDPRHAPLVRTVLIQGRERAALLFTAHHAIADGFSSACAIRDILSALAGTALPLHSLPSAQESVLGLNGDLDEGFEPPKDPAGKPSTFRPKDAARPKVQGLNLSMAATLRLRERARRHGTTVHGALCAAFLLAARDLSLDWQDLPLRILSPINTRNILGLGERWGLFVSATSGSFDHGNQIFWSLAREARLCVSLAQSPRKIRQFSSVIHQLVNRKPTVAAISDFTAQAFASEVTISNLGSLPFGQQFGPIRLEALWGPAVVIGRENEHTIGAATVAGSLCLTYTSHTPKRGLLETMQNHLKAAIAV